MSVPGWQEVREKGTLSIQLSPCHAKSDRYDMQGLLLVFSKSLNEGLLFACPLMSILVHYSQTFEAFPAAHAWISSGKR